MLDIFGRYGLKGSPDKVQNGIQLLECNKLTLLKGSLKKMKLYWYQGRYPNFGDEINRYIWPVLIPSQFFDDDESEIFLGVGSVLFDYHPSKSTKYVFGSGYGGYTPPPDVHDGTWKIYFVRGPRTAKSLGLDDSLAIADSGILIKNFVSPPSKIPDKISFMPHWASLDNGCWESVCKDADIFLLDPRNDVESILDQILQSKLIIAEAMHGAIVADALRIPWIPILPLDSVNRIKWWDWAESLGVLYNPKRLTPSSLRELKLTLLSGSRFASKAVSVIEKSFAKKYAQKSIMSLASKNLLKISKMDPFLSKDGNVDSSIDKILSKIEVFKREVGLK